MYQPQVKDLIKKTLLKFRTFVFQKTLRMKGQPQIRRYTPNRSSKVFSNKGLVSRQAQKSISKRQTTLFLIIDKRLNTYLTKDDIQMASKHMKRWSASLVISKTQNRTMRSTTQASDWLKLKNLNIPAFGRSIGSPGSLDQY